MDKDGDAGAGAGTAGGGTAIWQLRDEVFKLKRKYNELFKELEGRKLGLARWADEIIQGQSETSRQWDDLDTKVKALAAQAEGTVRSIGALTQKEEPCGNVVDRLMRRVEGCEANFHTSMARFQARMLAVEGRLPAEK